MSVHVRLVSLVVPKSAASYMWHYNTTRSSSVRNLGEELVCLFVGGGWSGTTKETSEIIREAKLVAANENSRAANIY